MAQPLTQRDAIAPLAFWDGDTLEPAPAELWPVEPCVTCRLLSHTVTSWQRLERFGDELHAVCVRGHRRRLGRFVRSEREMGEWVLA